MGIFGGGADTVVKKGSVVDGRLVGISMRERGGDPPTRIEEYAVELADGRVLGVRQRLDPTDVVRLGMPVRAWVHRDEAVIDWAASTAALGVTTTNDWDRWKAVDPPARGIVDTRLDLEKAASTWTPATLDLHATRVESVAFGLAHRLVFDLVVHVPGEQPYGCELRLDAAPAYARHLPVPGRRLRGYVDPRRPDRVRVDWPACAMAEPGVGVPPIRFDRSEPDLAGAFGMASPSVRAPGPAGAPAVVDPPPPIDGVSFEQWLSIERALKDRKLSGKPKQWDAVAAEFGVAPGAYAKVSGKWAMSMARRPDLAAAYAAALG